MSAKIGKAIISILLVMFMVLCACACSSGNNSSGSSSTNTVSISEQDLVGQWQVVKIEDHQGNIQYERTGVSENGAVIEFWYGNRCQYTLPGSQTKGTWEIDENGTIIITLAEDPSSEAKLENGKLVISDDAYIMSCEKAS